MKAIDPKKIKRYAQDVADANQMSLVNEPLSMYGILSNTMMMVKAIQAGVPQGVFQAIKNLVPLTIEEWAEFLNISTKSLQRYESDDQRFKPIHSEKIIELAEVSSHGVRVFGSLDAFKNWLDTPSFALSNFTPKSLLKNSYGKELVLNEIHRIDHGVFA